MVIYICIKFQENISNSFQVTEQCVLHIGVKFHENTCISNGIRVMERTRKYEALTDRRTDTQNFGRYNIIPRHFLWRGIQTKKKKNGI